MVVSLYMAKLFKQLFKYTNSFCCINKRNKLLLIIYDKVDKIIDNEVNFVRLLKQLRDLKILQNNEHINIKTSFFVDHSNENVINVVEDEEIQEDVCTSEEEFLEIDQYIMREENKIIFKKKFGLDLGKPSIGFPLPRNYIGSKIKQALLK